MRISPLACLKNSYSNKFGICRIGYQGEKKNGKTETRSFFFLKEFVIIRVILNATGILQLYLNEEKKVIILYIETRKNFCRRKIIVFECAQKSSNELD